MLEQSKTELGKASESERRTAGAIALRYLACELEENLLPADEAERTARAHKEANDETWQRAVYGILLGLRAAAGKGHTVPS